MKKLNLYIISVFIASVAFTSCKNHSETDKHQHDLTGNHITPETSADNPDTAPIQQAHSEGVELTQAQIDVLNIKIDTLVKRNMSSFIQVNGQLGVPPQNEAVVTSTLGANINSIKTIEGEKVRKGQILAYISHPDIITIQTDYLQTYNRLIFLEQEYNRQKKLYDSQVASGRDYQKAQSTFFSTKGLAKGFESQLHLLGLSPKSIRSGNLSQVAPIKSPINGYIEKVHIKSGQYVQPQTPIFEIVNTEHIHADLMVFEKDANKVKNGQLVKFSIESLGNKEMTAKIYSVGKSFEENPKALHIHAEIENKDKNLIPGMYVNARIIINDNLEQALPKDAIFQEGETFYVFTAKKKADGNWEFIPHEVVIKSTNNRFIAFDFIQTIDKNTLVAQSGAYYLMAEMKKTEAEHSH